MDGCICKLRNNEALRKLSYPRSCAVQLTWGMSCQVIEMTGTVGELILASGNFVVPKLS